MDPDATDASRRTYLAEERTLLAWWRSGLAALAVSLGVGRLLPAILEDGSRAPYVALGVGYAVLGLGLVVFGWYRERVQSRALATGRFVPLPAAVTLVISGYLGLLALATLALVIVE